MVALPSRIGQEENTSLQVTRSISQIFNGAQMANFHHYHSPLEPPQVKMMLSKQNKKAHSFAQQQLQVMVHLQALRVQRRTTGSPQQLVQQFLKQENGQKLR